VGVTIIESGRQQGHTVADRFPSGSVDRDSLRLVFVVCCLLAVTAAAALVASTGAGLAGSPLDRLLPGEEIPDYRTNDSTDGPLDSVEDGGGFGSLTPGRQTGTGGDTGFDRDTFVSNDTSVHFVVESPRPTYWRTGAYDTYTGSGWERTTDTEPLEGSVDYDEPAAQRLEYEVELERPASALPTPWRPTAVSGVDELWRTDSGAVEPTTRADAGTTYSGVSQIPERDPDLLRAAGEGYPEEIERQYTALPAGASPRVADRAARITADADTTYDTATAIQAWLRGNKDYSLQASARSTQITETFLFEMEAGYCEYFATAMTVMLRTQDIPARYVVGYTSGQPTGDGTYEVRGMNAHAWVEVYFDGYGWVRFDPTPGDSRLDAQSELVEDYDVQEPGSPGETFEPGADDSDEQDDENDTDPDSTDPVGSDDDPLSLNATPVAGETTKLNVTHNGTAVTNALVRFDGQRVGRTDDGSVTGTVPDVSELRVTAEHPVFAPDGGTVTQNFTVDTGARVRVIGQTVPGASVTVTALLGEGPVENASVSVDGTTVAETDTNGQATVSLPEQPGTTTIAVERGAIAGTTAVELPELSVTVESDLPVALPFGPATVEATYGNVSAAGASVTVDGNVVTELGPDGTASVRFPLSPSATVAVTQNGVTDQVTVDALGLNLAAVGVVAFVVSLTVAALVRFRRSVRGALAVPVGVLASGGRRSGARELVDTLAHVLVSLRSLLSLPGLWSTLGWGDNETTSSPEQTDDAARTAVREGWERFLDHVSVPAATRTPEELAAHATERDGLPAGPVQTLRDAFRAVEYGSRPADDWADRVEAAVEAIEEATQADTEGD